MEVWRLIREGFVAGTIDRRRDYCMRFLYRSCCAVDMRITISSHPHERCLPDCFRGMRASVPESCSDLLARAGRNSLSYRWPQTSSTVASGLRIHIMFWGSLRKRLGEEADLYIVKRGLQTSTNHVLYFAIRNSV
jgi:hypothetical protein